MLHRHITACPSLPISLHSGPPAASRWFPRTALSTAHCSNHPMWWLGCEWPVQKPPCSQLSSVLWAEIVSLEKLGLPTRPKWGYITPSRKFLGLGSQILKPLSLVTTEPESVPLHSNSDTYQTLKQDFDSVIVNPKPMDDLTHTQPHVANIKQKG